MVVGTVLKKYEAGNGVSVNMKGDIQEILQTDIYVKDLSTWG